MSDCQYIYNDGHIVLQKDGCFWFIPQKHLNINKDVCSPWFSCMGKKWRIVKEQNACFFNVWSKIRSNPPKHKYTIQLSLEKKSSNYLFQSDSVNIDSADGCKIHIRMPHRIEVLCHSGLLKLIFNLKKQKDAVLSTQNEDASEDEEANEDEDASENEEASEDEEANEDEETNEDEEVETNEEKNSNNESSTKKKTAKGIKRLAQNLKQLFLDGEMCDAVLKVDNREFNIHKAILVARSPVFASMFQHDLAEKNNNLADIPDCTAESFEVFLHYLYSGSADAMSTNNVYNVYYAADKYGVDDLKEECVEFMKNNLTLETFCDVIALSLHHGEYKLQKIATRFFSKNIKKIIKTVQWQRYMSENSTHANELLIKALKA